MPLVYLVIDHWSNFEEELYKLGIRRFFLTDMKVVKPALDRSCDIILDNGAYRFRRARFDWCIYGAKLGIKYIMPDVLENPVKTFEYHYKFANMVSEEELKNGFVVLQASTLRENIEWLERYRELGIVKRYVAFGGPVRFRKKKSLDEKIVRGLYAYCKRYGYHFHVLGRARYYCDSFDTASWGYRMLDQKLSNKGYNVRPVLKFVRKWETI